MSAILHNMFDAQTWAAVPFHFWSVVFFVFGSMVGSFLNVVIHRLPIGESIVSPPSHCPHCKYAIPWYLNVPLVTWVYLRGRCRNCGAPISIRYFLVELLTALLFLGCWLAFGHRSALLALVHCLFLAGLIAGTFIDFEHYIVPDEITFGGMIVGVLLSFFIPHMHGRDVMTGRLTQSLLGIAVGAGIVYGVLRLGKVLFGRRRVRLQNEARVVFTETALHLPDQEIPYEEIFSRRTDVIRLRARTVELADRCYRDVAVRLGTEKLEIGDEQFNPEEIPHLEAVTSQVVLPREAMGLGDVKLMGAIGAFLGWPAVIFSLMASSIIGTLIIGSLILTGKRARSAPLPYVPYIAMAAAIWVFLPEHVQLWWYWNLRLMGYVFFRIPLPSAVAPD